MTIPPDAPNINYCWSGLLIEELTRIGVAGFVLSPGSRNSPLAITVARHARAPYWMHFDERGAAFFALGLARYSGRPAVLIGTSGSAAANYWPAVVEAGAARIPLIVITADRPPELLDCGANQAIDQTHLFGRYVRWDATLPCPDATVDPAFVLTTADQAVCRSMAGEQGPVHVNCMFREPLAPIADASVPANYLDTLAGWAAGYRPHTETSGVIARLGDGVQARLLDTVQTCTRGLLAVGALRGAAETAHAATLARDLGWPVYADICSGLRGTPDIPGLLHYGDLVLLDGQLDTSWQPEFVLHVGGSITSKRFQTALARWRPQYARVCAGFSRRDPGHLVTLRCAMPAGEFCSWLSACISGNKPKEPPASWMQRNDRCAPALRAWESAQETLSEILVARLVASGMPPHSLLFLGNSMPVRLVDSFGCPAGPDVVVAANRGASGIDGNIATAAGLAVAAKRPAVALVGDLTALHDLNSLALLHHASAPFVLVILNNDGGGIFHHLPVSEYTDVFETCFGTPHGLNFADAAGQFKIPYQRPDTISEFKNAFAVALASPGPSIMEVELDRQADHARHLALRELLRRAIQTPER